MCMCCISQRQILMTLKSWYYFQRGEKMKIAKKLACLMLTVITVLAHVPVTAFALEKNVDKPCRTDTWEFKFDEPKKTFDTIGEEYSLDRDLVNRVEARFVTYSCTDGDGVITVDENGLLKVVGEGTATVVAETTITTDEEGYVDASTSEIKKATSSEATPATIHVNQPYKATLKVTVRLESSGGSGSSGGSSGGGGGSGGGGSSRAATNGGTYHSYSGATVTSNTSYLGNGSRLTTATITIGGRTINVMEKVSALPDGSSQRYYSVDGDLSGITFAGGGVVSEDGSTIKTPDGKVYKITYAPMCIVTDINGGTVGCFLDPKTGQPVAFGEDTVLMQIGMDGQMHAHFINPQGYFYTGKVEMNGSVFMFSEDGIMISYA